jgi:tRNA 2-thiouridine synthesizing protein A
MLAEDSFIDLTGVPCPINFVRAKLLIDTLKFGQILRMEVDNGEPIESVSKSMKEEGHEIVQVNKFEFYTELFIKVASKLL